MCMVCMEWNKGKMNIQEVRNAITEMIIFEKDEKKIEHLLKIYKKIKEEQENE